MNATVVVSADDKPSTADHQERVGEKTAVQVAGDAKSFELKVGDRVDSTTRSRFAGDAAAGRASRR